MTMTHAKSLKWLNESQNNMVDKLRAALDGEPDENVIDAMIDLYRHGWNDCYMLARIHGVKAWAWNEGE